MNGVLSQKTYSTSSGAYELNHEGAIPSGLITAPDRLWVLFGYADCKSNKHGPRARFQVRGNSHIVTHTQYTLRFILCA